MNSEAIKKTTGPCVILAGAGTGKTYTIVEKIKYLIENKIYPPEKIVCITFSNEAANNLSLRVSKIVGQSSAIIRTFHGFSADLLRKYGSEIGISKEFKILDPDQAKVVLHRNLKINPINCHRYISAIGSAKDLGITLNEMQNFISDRMKKYEVIDIEKRFENLNFELQTIHLSKSKVDKKELVKEIKNIKDIIEMKKFSNCWNAYEKLKSKGNYLDYSDLNILAISLFDKNPEVAVNFDYIIVDEFQDTNKLQLDFLARLAPHKNITIVGDINQSIYRFRGAYKDNLSYFKKQFSVSEKDIFNLKKSYRSPNTVLKAAHKLISNNYDNEEDLFFVENAHNLEGEKIKVYEMKNAQEEARKVVELIKHEQQNQVPLEEICVMFRAHQYGRIIKIALEQAGIPYHSVSKSSLLKQKSVKTVVDYLTILNKLKRKEKGGEQAWWDLAYQLNFQQEDLIKIGKMIKSLSKSRARNKGNGSLEIEEVNGKELPSVYLFNNIMEIDLSDDGKLAAKILIERIKLMLGFLDKPISALLQEVYRISGLANEQKTIEEKEIMLNLSKFYEIAKSHEELYDSDLYNFLYYLQVLEDLDIEIDAAQLEEEGVRLMSCHSTKGLEFRTVIITNMAQGRFPIERYVNNSLIPTELFPDIKEEIKRFSDEEKKDFLVSYEKHHQMQEERRLAYVSFTRAKEKLVFTYSKEYSGKEFLPSQFLNEVNYKSNTDFSFEKDLDQKYTQEERKNEKNIPEFSTALQYQNFPEVLNEIVSSNSVVEKKKENKRLSPSALILFSNCQKEFEYKYVFNMPERKKISWEAMRLGSFVHLVLEKGVKSGFSSLDEFLQLAKELNLDDEWESVELSEAQTMVRVFFERHKGRYDSNSKTEQFLNLKIGGIDFIGFADRIDFINGGAQIVDYKTGKSNIGPKERNWQLGFYALAAEEKYGLVRKVILDMLRQERPIEFEIDNDGNAVCTSSKFIDGFNIKEVKKEIIDIALKIQECYKNGFSPCPIEKNCEFCNEYVYGL